jgi:acetyl-CoA carboxylase biotin carboxyl carrier protein
MTQPVDGRRFVVELEALTRRGEAERGEEQRTELLAPRPGLFRAAAPEGTLLAPGMVLGELEVLGARLRLRVPAGAQGIVVAHATRPRTARRPVEHGERLLTLDAAQVAGVAAIVTEAEGGARGSLAFRAPMSGRYYARPAPGAEAFLQVGDVVETGRTVAILEVMKTFNRVQYGGSGLPARARIAAIVPRDGDDVSAGDPLLQLEPV